MPQISCSHARFAVLISGSPSSGTAHKGQFQNRIKAIQTLNIYGKQDHHLGTPEEIKERTLRLAGFYEDAEIYMSMEGVIYSAMVALGSHSTTNIRHFRTHAIHEHKGRINCKRHRAIVTESEDSGSDCLSNLSNQDFQKQDVLSGAAHPICAMNSSL